MRYCKKCNGITDVTDSRYYLARDTTRRRRVCRDCGDAISTIEVEIDLVAERTARLKSARRKRAMALLEQ